MSGADSELLRNIENLQISLFRRFMAEPESREALIADMISLKARENELLGTLPLTFPEQPPPQRRISNSLTSPAALGRLAYFQPGRG
ncbi:hypothetical protein ACSBOB_20025 [Mesorhizobium sp. ASY16-5R]|uniref:hypothetical protein n=1 Tax=Mesorhizobium sp. ASY16-5R TaxID=3445772 RepID=UPI003FA142B7